METKEIGFEIKSIVVKPVTRIKFSGVSAYSRTQIVIGTELDGETGLYKTGLTPKEVKEFEDALSLPKGTLNPKSDWWGSITIRLNQDKPTYFTFSGAMDEIKYRVLRASSKVANSELDISKSPNVGFYIDDPEAKAAVESAMIDYELDAIEEFTKSSIETKRSLLRIFGKKGLDDMSETMIKAELYKKMKSDPKQFVEFATDPNMKVRALLEECIEKRVLVKKGPYYYNGEDMIGSSTDEVIAYLTDIKNQTAKLALENRVRKARK